MGHQDNNNFHQLLQQHIVAQNHFYEEFFREILELINANNGQGIMNNNNNNNNAMLQLILGRFDAINDRLNTIQGDVHAIRYDVTDLRNGFDAIKNYQYQRILSEVRTQNVAIVLDGGNEIRFPPNANMQLPGNRPRTIAQINHLTGPDVNNLLHFYGIAIPPNALVPARRLRLKQFIGLEN